MGIITRGEACGMPAEQTCLDELVRCGVNDGIRRDGVRGRICMQEVGEHAEERAVDDQSAMHVSITSDR
jgi:hypothetical protein